ncbi:MAG: polymerase protein [Parcubacteria group bacterium GW2011_GWA2_51_10]|nr:MAG: polymerase protein [Parcubacteria group bacterium GW2011_GWA2_51_10]
MKQNKKAKRVVLLDAHAIIHRAYHALPDFSSSKGEPTGALYGLITMLLKIAADLKPDYIAACFDLPGPTHRHTAYEAYKATRVKAEDELVAQLIRARAVFTAFGIPTFESPGFEADDLLGTIARQLSGDKNIEIIIASGDLDTLQLVRGKQVKVYTLRKGLSDTVMYDEDAVRLRFGFGPEQIADYKGLRGDPSDNIKGVAGIGEKTATELIKGFGGIEGIYNVLEKFPEKLKSAGIKERIIGLLNKSRKDAEFSKMLATIRTDAPVSYVLPPKGWNMGDYCEDILALCTELDFRSLKERIAALCRSHTPSTSTLDETSSETPTIDPVRREETAIALWLLNSDITNPSLGDILSYAKQEGTRDFDTAREIIFAELEKTGRLREVFEEIEQPLMPVIRMMNEVGVYLDIEYLRTLAGDYKRELQVIAERIYKSAGREFNINSPRQLGIVLYDELKLSLARQRKTPGGARTTREDELARMTDLHPVIADILLYRELHKLLSTYVEKMPAMVGEDGRLHAEFLQAGTTTGRIASRNPNLQNIPIKTEYGRKVRRGFCAAKGNLLVALDYSQIELRLAAGLSGDKKLVSVFEGGGDIHTEVAAQVFGVPHNKVDYEMRRRAKVINFGILYGMGVNALRANLGAGVSRDEAAAFLDAYFKKFTGLAIWIEKTKLDAARRGFTETHFGRRRYFPGFKSALPNLRSQAERMAVNAPLQGTQADIIKLAMVRADTFFEKENLRKSARLVLTVHDELVYEIEKSRAEGLAHELRHIMETVVSKKELSGVPIVAEAAIGEDWGKMERLPR